MPSQFEGLPLGLLEAMGAGLCCFVSNIDGMSEVIEHGRTGFLCPVANVPAWSRQVADLVANRTLCAEIGNTAKQFARVHFSAERMAIDTLKVYETAMHGSETSETMEAA